MHSLKDLFSTHVGRMGAAGIALVLGVGVLFIRYFLRHIQQDAEKDAAARR